MAVLLAYFSVVLIWATTPLTIQWSSDSLSFIAAVLLRMSIAFFIGIAINAALKRKMFAVPNAWKAYAAGAIGIFPNMPVVYWSAQYIPSGLVAVVFAMTPFVTGLMTFLLLKQNPFTVRRVFALVLALAGLVVIFHHQFHFNIRSVYGIAGILASCFMFSFSTVLVKKVNVNVDAFNQAIGTLLFALPGLLLVWFLVDGQLPAHVSLKSIVSVGYLSIFGSLVGASLFFYVLISMSPTAVSLITFMTPVLALILGAKVAHEVLSWELWMGASLVILALLMYLDLTLGVNLMKGLRARAWRENALASVRDEYIKFK
jgi:drug/metabolite transporter (DMT)-like permease